MIANQFPQLSVDNYKNVNQGTETSILSGKWNVHRPELFLTLMKLCE